MYAFWYCYSQKHYLSSIIHLKRNPFEWFAYMKEIQHAAPIKITSVLILPMCGPSCLLSSLICFEESKRVLNRIVLCSGSNFNLIWVRENQSTYHFWQLEGASFFNFFATKEARTSSSVLWSISGASGFWNSTSRNHEFLSLFFCVASKQV